MQWKRTRVRNKKEEICHEKTDVTAAGAAPGFGGGGVTAFAEEGTDIRNLIGDGENTISIAFDGQSFNEEALFGVLEDFYNETGISVEVIYVASTGGWGGFFSKIQTMIAGGDAPDVIRIAIEGFELFLDNGIIVPLNEYEEKYPEFAALVSDNHEKLTEPFTVDGQIYGYGFDWNNVVTHINLNLLEEAGLEMPDVEWTTEEFLEYAKAMTMTREDGTQTYGVYVPTSYFQLNAWLYNWGAAILSDDMTESVINSPEAVEMFQFLHDLIYVEGVAPIPDSATGGEGEFMSNQIGMIFGGRWLLNGYNTNGFYDVDVAYISTEAANQVISGVGIFPVAAASDKKDEAYKLSAWLCSADAQGRIMENGAIPTSTSCMETVREAEFPANSYIFADSADIARSVQCPAEYADLQEILDRYVGLIYADEMDVQSALDACKEEMDLVLMGF